MARPLPQARTWLAKGGFEGNRPEIGEDCLVLNVWTPGPDGGVPTGPRLAHGGGFEAGTGSMMLYDGTNIARRGDVVVVTINHRLGLTGHLHLADLSATSSTDRSTPGSSTSSPP
jgi:para-nitrobenzyl esterase